MSSIYDNWERLVGATLKREELRELARAPSLSSTSSDFSSRFSFSSPVHDHIPVNPEASSSPTTTFYNGESSGESLPKPRFEYREPINAILIPFKELKNATRNFQRDSIIAEGGFVTVFKGWIKEHTLNAAKPGSGMAVAIKKLNPKGLQGSNKLLRQVNYLSHFRHPNLIKFIACCTEGNNLLLVFEFMPKGSLECHLFRRLQCLSWSTRIKVAVDTARGISFLHDAKNQVIHQNVTSAFILLDEDFNVKLALPPPDDTHMTTQFVCTQGYSAPEYIATGSARQNTFAL